MMQLICLPYRGTYFARCELLDDLLSLIAITDDIDTLLEGVEGSLALTYLGTIEVVDDGIAVVGGSILADIGDASGVAIWSVHDTILTLFLCFRVLSFIV